MIRKNVDALYIKGDGHAVCQDYAYAHIGENYHCAVISDGCSSSCNTDIGARLLCMAFVSAFNDFVEIRKGRASEEFEETFDKVMSLQIGSHIIKTAQSMIDSRLLDMAVGRGSICDATVFGIFATEDKIYVGGWGDGFVVLDSKERLEVSEVAFTSGAPYYLSYFLDKDRDDAYAEMAGESSTFVNTQWSNAMMKGEDSVTIDPMEYPHFWRAYDYEDEMVISVLSDGAASFKGITSGEVVSQMTAFKNFNGDFVHRRLQSFKKKCVKDGLTHYDDLSCASLHVRKVNDD